MAAIAATARVAGMDTIDRSRVTAGILMAGGIFAVVTVGLYLVRTWAYRHPGNRWAEGALSIYG